MLPPLTRSSNNKTKSRRKNWIPLQLLLKNSEESLNKVPYVCLQTSSPVWPHLSHQAHPLLDRSSQEGHLHLWPTLMQMLRNEARLRLPTSNLQCPVLALLSQRIRHVKCRRRPRCTSIRKQMCSVATLVPDPRRVEAPHRSLQEQPLQRQIVLPAPDPACTRRKSGRRRDRLQPRHRRIDLRSDNSNSLLHLRPTSIDQCRQTHTHLLLLVAGLVPKPLLLQLKHMELQSGAIRTRPPEVLPLL